MEKPTPDSSISPERHSIKSDRPPHLLSSFMFRFSLLLIIWLTISGSIHSLWFGLPLAVISSYLSIRFSPSTYRLRLIPSILFIPFFLRESIRGGFDVARRAFSIKPVVNPAFTDYPLSLPEGAPRILFANIISLLPGTLGTGFQGNSLRIHVLDSSTNITSELKSLETRIAAIYAIDFVMQQNPNQENAHETF
ncbi:MAG: Na+/H+ antiporter subunit E [Gammaproteobacteria bacterium]|nr:Na+/H+ antiporter subunit E [Gammaproteobacteria bacterium]